MSKKIIIYVATLVALALLVGWLVKTKQGQFETMGAAGASFVPPPETVTAAKVTEDTWENLVVATGSFAPVQGVTVGAEMAGKVEKINFTAGATVAEGDLLVQLDVTNELAQLRAAEATATLAKLNLERARELRQSNTNSAADLDAADAQAKQATAAADGLRAIIAKKTIRAPFTGRLGLRLVNLGQILKDGEAIATLQTLDPIYVNFSIPQQQLGLLKVGATVRAVTDGVRGETFTGKITAISPEVDPVTRNVRVQATLANSAEHVRPGMFATVTVVLESTETKLVVPSTAVLSAPFGDTVYVIEEKKNEKSGAMEKVLRQQFISTGPARGDFISVVKGLKAGDEIVTTGAFKLRQGMAVIVDNKLAPPMNLAPTPENK